MTVGLATLMVVAPASALAAPATPTCTIDKSSATTSQTIVGTPGNDVICGGSAGDNISGGSDDGNPKNDACYQENFPFGSFTLC